VSRGALRVATRRSPLALAQSGQVAAALRLLGHEAELVPMTTSGDRWSAAGRPGDPGPGQAVKGMFVKELEEALLDGRADLAVHSAKDLPTECPDGLAVVAVPRRADPRDVLVGAPGGVTGLAPGARVGTTSPRRAAQLAALRPDVRVLPVRGNVDTRLRRLAEGGCDALLLAAAGLARLGLSPADATPLGIDEMTPAPGQGALALQARAGDDHTGQALRGLDDAEAHACLRAERALLHAVGGGCLDPVGALCAPGGGGLRLVAFRQDHDGARRAGADGDAADPEALGRAVARALG
jgi:hydroxymethylbilane synthase